MSYSFGAYGTRGYGGDGAPSTPSAGTTYTVSVAGSISSSGSLTKEAQIRKAGAAAIAGSLVKYINKGLDGTITSAGVMFTGNQYVINLSGAISSAGDLIRQTNKVVAGSVSPSGAVVKSVLRALTGAISSSGAAAEGVIKHISLSGSIASSGDVGVNASSPPPPGTFVVGTSPRDFLRKYSIFTSPDGITWTARSTPLDYTGGNEHVNCVAATSQRVVAGGGNGNTASRPKLMRSEDNGATWLGCTSPWRDTGSSSDEVFGIWYSPERSLWMAVGICGGTGAPLAATSPDGITWTACFTPVPFGGTFHTELPKTPRCVIYAKGAWWMGGQGGSGGYHTLAKSTDDGATWTSVANQWFENTSTAGSILTLACDGTTLVAGGYQGTSLRNKTIQTSTDGVTWTAQTCAYDKQSGQATGGTAIGIRWSPAAGLWIAAGQNFSFTISILTSPDAVTWTSRGQPVGSGNAVAEDNVRGRYVVVGQAGTNTIARSDDATTWTSEGDPTAISGSGDVNLNAVTVQPAFVPTYSRSFSGSVGSSGAVSLYRWPSMGTWENRTAPTLHQYAGAVSAYGGKIYTFCGRDPNAGSSAVKYTQAYDPLTDTWTRLADLPLAMSFCTAITVGSAIWVFGTPDTGFNARCFVYDPVANTWSTPAGSGSFMPSTIPGNEMPVAYANNAFWAIDGSGQPSRMDPTNPTAGWVSTGYPVRPDGYHGNAATFGIGNKVYQFGGGFSGGMMVVTAILDTTTLTWSTAAPNFEPRTGAVAVQYLDGTIWLMGGSGYNGTSFYKTDHVDIYDPVANTWRPGSPDNDVSSSSGIAVVGGAVLGTYMYLYRDESSAISSTTAVMFERLAKAPIELTTEMDVDVDLWPFPALISDLEVAVDVLADMTIDRPFLMIPGFVYTGNPADPY